MNFAKKAISAATSAALLASLVATAVAPAAQASIAVTTSSGSTVVGKTSANPFVLTLTENNAPDFTGGTIIVTLPATVTFSGTPTVTASASVGISSSVVAGNVLTITTTGGNSSFIDTILVSSKITVGATTPTGAIIAQVTGTAAGAFQGTTTVTGVLAGPLGSADTSAVVTSAGPCYFATGAVTIGSTAVTVTGVTGTSSPQTLAWAAGLGVTYVAGTAVTESGVACNSYSVGTAVNGLAYAAVTQPNMSADTNNNVAGNLTVTESNAGTLAKGAVLNFAITTPGVTLSGRAPTASWTAGDGTFVSNTATVDTTTWKTFSFTVNSASSVTTGDVITVTSIWYDLAPTVPAGTQVQVSLTNSGGVPQDNASASNAIVGNQIAAVAATPTVFIGYNGQNTGMITLTEKAAGYFTASTGNNNEIWVCSPETFETITTAPWAVVVSPVAGSLTLVSPTTGLPVSQALATKVATDHLGNTCWGWSVYAASTVASSIQILGTNATNTAPLPAGPNNGMQINVPTNSTPGPVYLDVRTGYPYNSVTSQILTIAYRAFKNQLTIAASSAPWMMPGTINNPAGNLVLTETQVGQLSAGNDICVDVHDGDVDFGALNTSALPLAVADTNVSGLIVGPVSFSGYDCSGHWQGQLAPNVPEPSQYLPYAYSFHFPIVQGSTSAHGTVTISNIKYNVFNDATLGIVALNVYISSGALQDSQGFVVNANIGTQPTVKIGAATAVGATKNATFTTKTKVVKLGGYVTWKFSLPAALVGKTVTIWVSTKQADGTWGASKALTTRLIDLNGNAYFWWKSASATWVAVKASYGDTTYGMSVSPSPQARWIK